MLALSLSDNFCWFGIFVFVFVINFFVIVFNRFLFFRFSFHHFFVLVGVFVNEFVIFSFFTIFVFVFINENHTGSFPGSHSLYLDEVIDADEIAVLVVTQLPRSSVCYQMVGHVQSLGKVDHPRTDMYVVTDNKQRTTDDLFIQHTTWGLLVLA